MAFDYSFTADEMAIDDGLGYPKAYAKLCRDRSAGPYSHGPPFTFHALLSAATGGFESERF
ncbi:hypothetical protein GBA52_009868 [Prunus armeniaca]|nr:hypothetical protein GBA52_009868 [Prunus armeniaca]